MLPIIIESLIVFIRKTSNVKEKQVVDATVNDGEARTTVTGLTSSNGSTQRHSLAPRRIRGYIQVFNGRETSTKDFFFLRSSREFRSCVKVAVDRAPVPNKPTVSVDVEQHFNNNKVLEL